MNPGGIPCVFYYTMTSSPTNNVYKLFQMRENVGKAVRGRRGGQQSGAHDQRPVDGLRGDGRGEPGGIGVLPGPGDARATPARRLQDAGRVHAFVPGRAGGGGRGHR